MKQLLRLFGLKEDLATHAHEHTKALEARLW
jgi:hypothetical protein